jgi:tetratricopeptide (TPR) repeat protein
MRSVWLWIALPALVLAQAPDAEQLFHQAIAAQQRGDDATAIAKYRELVQLRPEVVEVRANLGAALAHAGRYDEAIEQYQVALAKLPDNAGCVSISPWLITKRVIFPTPPKSWILCIKPIRPMSVLPPCWAIVIRAWDGTRTPFECFHPPKRRIRMI